MTVYTMVDGKWVGADGILEEVVIQNRKLVEEEERRRARIEREARLDEWIPARAAAQSRAYFEARLALLHRPDVRLRTHDVVGDDRGVRRQDLIVVIAEWWFEGRHAEGGLRQWEATWEVSVSHVHEPHLLATQADTFARAIDRRQPAVSATTWQVTYCGPKR